MQASNKRKVMNRFGLPRDIPADVAREVRVRSKFGCVNCRKGLYAYHHFSPSYADAKEHKPDGICCLCAECHDLVTRRHLSNFAVEKAYAEIQQASNDMVGKPTGPLDFSDGNAELVIGGLSYSPAVTNVVRYDGQNIMSVSPGVGGAQGSITAIFTDDNGHETMRLDGNVWTGVLDTWDIRVEGPTLTVRRGHRDIVLRLVLEPPGRIVIDHLDMRINDCHLLVSRRSYAAGRYLTPDDVLWVHSDMRMVRSSPAGAAIDFASSEVLQQRLERQKECGGQWMVTADELFATGNDIGTMCIPAGVAIGTLCGAIMVYKQGCAVKPLSAARRIVFGSNTDIDDLFKV